MPGCHSYRKQQLSAWVDDEVAEKVERRARVDRVTKSDVVRSAIEMYLDVDDGSRDSLVRIEAKLDAVLASIRESDAGEVEDISAPTAEPLEDREQASGLTDKESR